MTIEQGLVSKYKVEYFYKKYIENHSGKSLDIFFFYPKWRALGLAIDLFIIILISIFNSCVVVNVL